MNPLELFENERQVNLARQRDSADVQQLTQRWIGHPDLKTYSYNFNWLGRPVIQYPQDLIAMQELLFTIQPDCIIETGIAHGGSLIFYASLLELNALCGGPKQACVYGVDIDIREHNREAIEAHPLYSRGRIHMLQGSSVTPEMIKKIHEVASGHSKILVVLDSNHTHAHVLAELEAYAQLVTPGSYCVVFDTIVARMPENAYPDRPWNIHDNPMTAVQAWLPQHPEFEIDAEMDSKLLISVAPSGYLRRTR